MHTKRFFSDRRKSIWAKKRKSLFFVSWNLIRPNLFLLFWISQSLIRKNINANSYWICNLITWTWPIFRKTFRNGKERPFYPRDVSQASLPSPSAGDPSSWSSPAEVERAAAQRGRETRWEARWSGSLLLKEVESSRRPPPSSGGRRGRPPSTSCGRRTPPPTSPPASTRLATGPHCWEASLCTVDLHRPHHHDSSSLPFPCFFLATCHQITRMLHYVCSGTTQSHFKWSLHPPPIEYLLKVPWAKFK